MLKSLKLLVAMILSISALTAHAELNDTTTITIKSEIDQDIVHTFTGDEAKWLISPNFSVPSNLIRRLDSGRTYHLKVVVNIDVNGYIVDANILTTSGDRRLDEHVLRQLSHSRMMPYIVDTQPVVSRAIIPIYFIIPE